MKAISVSVYREARYKGSSVGGISEKFDELLLLHDRGNLEITGNEENLCKAVYRKIYNRDVYHIEPVNRNTQGGWFTAGGSFAYSSDTRFSELVGGQYGAISIHDRLEWNIR